MIERLFGSAVIAVALASTATPLWAVNPHFVSASGSGTLSAGDGDGDMLVTFKEAGLGQGQTVNYTVYVSSATATYACINGGGSHPQAANKMTVSTSLIGTGTFTANNAGNIVGTITLEEPGPGNFSCPGGQSLVLSSVTYTGITLSDDLSHSISIADVTDTFCPIDSLTKATVKSCLVVDSDTN